MGLRGYISLMNKKIIAGLISISALVLPIADAAHAVPSKPAVNGGEGGEGGGEEGTGSAIVLLGGAVVIIGGIGYLIGRRKK